MFKKASFAIVVVAYNRVDSLSRLLNSLLMVDYEDDIVPLVISVDKSEGNLVENFSKNFVWPYGNKEVLLHAYNLGLRRHMMSLGCLFEYYDAFAVFEDDIFVSPRFYTFAKRTISYYENDNKIAGISLYSFSVNYQTLLPFVPQHSSSDVYFMNCAQSWGQIWMKNQWNDFYLWYKDNSNEFGYLPHLPKVICDWSANSWLKYHTKYCIEKDKYFVYPYISFSTNFSDIGIHSVENTSIFQVPIEFNSVFDLNLEKFNEEHSVCYDGFFERKFISSYLGIGENELTVDFYGSKSDLMMKKYLLSSKLLNCKVCKKFSLCLKPYEMNIIYNIRGEGLMLYDTEYKQDNMSSFNYSTNKFMYLMGVSGNRWELVFAFLNIRYPQIIAKICLRIKKLIV